MLIKPFYLAASFCLLAACGMTIGGLVTNEWTVRSYARRPSGTTYLFGTDQVQVSERTGVNGRTIVRFKILGFLGDTTTPSNWGVSYDVALDAWRSSCSINGYTIDPAFPSNVYTYPGDTNIMPRLAVLPNFAEVTCNLSSAGGIGGGCDELKAHVDALKADTTTSQDVIDVEDFKYKVRCPIAKATLAFWAASGFFFLLTALIAILPSFEKATTTPLFAFLIVTWIIMLTALGLGIAIPGMAKHSGICDVNNGYNTKDRVIGISYCNVGFSFLLTAGAAGATFVATVLSVIGWKLDQPPAANKAIPLATFPPSAPGATVPVITVVPGFIKPTTGASPASLPNNPGGVQPPPAGSPNTQFSQLQNQFNSQMQNAGQAAQGAQTQAAGLQKQGQGLQNQAQNQIAGAQNQAAGLQNQAAGLQNQAQGFQNQAAGLQNQAARLQNQAQGFQNQAQGQLAGVQNQASGLQNQAQTQAAGLQNQAQGFQNQAAGQFGGLQNQAQGFQNQAQGYQNQAQNQVAGLQNQASGFQNQAAGFQNQAAGASQSVQNAFSSFGGGH